MQSAAPRNLACSVQSAACLQSLWQGDLRIAAPARVSRLDTWTILDRAEHGAGGLTCEKLAGVARDCNHADSEKF
jgi:hypothetical protein